MSKLKLASCLILKNPRALDQLRLSVKPSGYQFESDNKNRSFYYRLELRRDGKHTTGQIRHHKDGVVLSASTREPHLAKHLYSTRDWSAAQNVGRVLARRCEQVGITQVHSHMQTAQQDDQSQNKLFQSQRAFIEAIRDAGISLSEGEQIKPDYSRDKRYHYVEERILPM